MSENDEIEDLIKVLQKKQFMMSYHRKRHSDLKQYKDAYNKLETLFRLALMCADLGLFKDALNLEGKLK